MIEPIFEKSDSMCFRPIISNTTRTINISYDSQETCNLVFWTTLVHEPSSVIRFPRWIRIYYFTLIKAYVYTHKLPHTWTYTQTRENKNPLLLQDDVIESSSVPTNPRSGHRTAKKKIYILISPNALRSCIILYTYAYTYQ